MVIAEALNKIKDLEKMRREVTGQLDDVVYVLPDMEVHPPSVEKLLEHYLELSTQIAELKVKIVATNIATEIEVLDVKDTPMKLSIMAAIKLMETYRNLEARYTKLIELMESKRARFYSHGGFGSEQSITLTRNFNIETPSMLRIEVIGLRNATRRVEQAIIKANWNINLL